MSHKAQVTSYIVGFFLSLVLTLGAFIPVWLYQNVHSTVFSQQILFLFIIVLAFVQLGVQLLFFLHLGREKKPWYNAFFLIITSGMIFIVIVGSLWIMHHLNYNMTPQNMEHYLMEDEGYQK